jgi:hypothetical protein
MIVRDFCFFAHGSRRRFIGYLKAALRVVKPTGAFIFSCTPLNTAIGKEIFLNSAKLDLKHRWKIRPKHYNFVGLYGRNRKFGRLVRPCAAISRMC